MHNRTLIREAHLTTSLSLAVGDATQRATVLTNHNRDLSMDPSGVYMIVGDKTMFIPMHRVEYIEL